MHTKLSTYSLFWWALALIVGISFLLALLFPVERLSAAPTVKIYLDSGTSFVIPGDWNSSNNSIEVIGGGGGGGTPSALCSAGGGGGAYSKAANVSLTAGASVTYAIGDRGIEQTAGGDTYFCNSTLNCASISGTAVQAGAKGGNGASGGTGGSGGASASGVGSTKFSGGNGAGTGSSTGGGGGGAAGLNGAGNNGSGTTGGSGDAGNGGAGGTANNPGGAGTEYDSVHGSGGGGGGATGAGGGAAGGNFGGAGGGGCASGGIGKRGMIVLTYVSSATLTLSGNVKFAGNLTITSTLAKSSGTFVIDHPLTPRTHLLYHSFVESPEVKNLYDGIAKLDAQGEVAIELPDYFEALNKDFRYQFFPHFEAMPGLYVKQEVKDNSFIIAGGKPGGEISWQVTGIRHDAFILANPIIVEVPKTNSTVVPRGMCLFEPLCK